MVKADPPLDSSSPLWNTECPSRWEQNVEREVVSLKKLRT
jgi:hypothetical protein